MKYLPLFLLGLAACSTVNKHHSYQRHIASTHSQSLKFELELSSPFIFPNGADHITVVAKIFEANNQALNLNPKEIKFITSSPSDIAPVIFKNGVYQTTIRPKVNSKNIKIIAIYNDQQSDPILLKSIFSPLKDKLIPLKSQSNLSQYIAGFTFTRQDFLPEGQYEGFRIDNDGINEIVRQRESSRTFEFEYPEQARQNISLMVSDSPNSTVSHTMHSHFMFFPRKYFFNAVLRNGEQVVTLPNGEKLTLSKTGEITDGVFEEGPVDYGPDRFTRTYADLKYQGKGILLRANARGQMPQQGQFESTKIDMDYGIKYSADVLIINGTTGQRCRRPKSDFWLSADVSPIEFKFPSDKEFNTYLQNKCGFGIPEFSSQEENKDEEIAQLVSATWNFCKEKDNVNNCISDETSSITPEDVQTQVLFELREISYREKQKEEKTLNKRISLEVDRIRQRLILDTSWVKSYDNSELKSNCLEYSFELVEMKLHYHELKNLISPILQESCLSVRGLLDEKASREVSSLHAPLLQDFSWVDLQKEQKITLMCQEEVLKRNPNLEFARIPEIYHSPLRANCKTVEDSSEFNQWLKTQSVYLIEMNTKKATDRLVTSAEIQARKCLEKYPTDSQLNRIRYKRVREACLLDAWPPLENEALKSVSGQNLLEKVRANIQEQRRILQIRIIKQFFQ